MGPSHPSGRNTGRSRPFCCTRLVLASIISSLGTLAASAVTQTVTVREHSRATRKEPTLAKGSPHALGGRAPQSEAASQQSRPQPLPLHAAANDP